MNDFVAIYEFPAFTEGLVIHVGQIFWKTVNPQQRGCNPNANGNWPGEENPLIANGGPQAHLPRFYVKKRVPGRTSTGETTGTIQYIATRHPLVLSFDDEAGILDEPTDPNDPQGPIRFPMGSGRPDQFKGQIASIFCKEKLGDVGNTKTEDPWKNCRVVELLVGLCLRDETPRKLPGLQPPDYHSNILLVNQAFPAIRTVFPEGQGHIIINEDSRLQARAMVMNSPLCPRFARIALPIGKQDQAGRQTLNIMREWRKHLQAAREHGYVMALVLIPCGVQYRWNIYRVSHLENLGGPAGKGALRDIMTQSILPDDFTYWYFCCAQNGPNCN